MGQKGAALSVILFGLAIIALLSLGVAITLNRVEISEHTPSSTNSVCPQLDYSSVPVEKAPSVGWKLCANNNYGFAISYPENWFLTSEDDGRLNCLSFGNEDYVNSVGKYLKKDGDILLSILFDRNNTVASQMFSEKAGYTSKIDPRWVGPGKQVFRKKILKLSNLTVGGYPAIKYKVLPTSGGWLENEIYFKHIETTYAIKKDPYIYTIAFGTRSKTTSDANDCLFDQIASSFQFIPSPKKENFTLKVMIIGRPEDIDTVDVYQGGLTSGQNTGKVLAKKKMNQAGSVYFDLPAGDYTVTSTLSEKLRNYQGHGSFTSDSVQIHLDRDMEEILQGSSAPI